MYERKVKLSLVSFVLMLTNFLFSTPTPVPEDTHSHYLRHVAQACVLLSSASGLSTHGIRDGNGSGRPAPVAGRVEVR